MKSTLYLLIVFLVNILITSGEAKADLETNWPIRGYATYELARSDGSILYSSTVFLEVAGNQVYVYNTYLRDPLGSFSRCGGLGCDLGRGSRIGSLSFRNTVHNQSPIYSILNSDGQASFMQGSICQVIDDNVFDKLMCRTLQGPHPEMTGTNWRDQTYVIFTPGT